MGQPNKLRSGNGVRGTLAERKARFREVKDLVTGLRRDVDTPTHLSPLARGVLGLMQVGIHDIGPIAFYMNEDRVRVVKVKMAIERSKNPIVVRARTEGLPVCASAKVLWGTRLHCGRCKLPLSSVPCPKCAPLWADHYPAVQVYQAATQQSVFQPEPEPPAAKSPTTILKRFEHLYEEPVPKQGANFEACDAMPGSDDKMRVLTYRVENGLPLWHPDDRRHYSTNLS